MCHSSQFTEKELETFEIFCEDGLNSFKHCSTQSSADIINVAFTPF